jgi:hypothetical protein
MTFHLAGVVTDVLSAALASHQAEVAKVA